MRNNQLVLLFGGLIATLSATSSASQTEAGKKPTYLGPPPPEELKILAPLVGTWKAEAVVRPSVENKEGTTGSGEFTTQWIHNGHFLRQEGTLEYKIGRVEGTVMMTYDPKQKVIRRWAFTSSGVAAQTAGQWDEKTKTLTFKVSPAADVSGEIRVVVEKDHFVETHRFVRDDGTVVRDLTIKAVRKK